MPQTSILTAHPARVTYRWTDDLSPAYAAAERKIGTRKVRRSATAMIAESLAGDRADRLEHATPTDDGTDWASDLADVNRYADLTALLAYEEALHDDLLDQHLAERADLDNSAEQVFLAQHELGYGDHFDPDEIQWGFRVTTLDKAPGVTSGRPVPASLLNAHN